VKRPQLRDLTLVVAALAVLNATAISQAADVEPARDHPLLGRYEGARMTQYRPPRYDEAVLVKAPVSKNSEFRLRLEGNVSFYSYDLPPDRSGLEVFRNYESGLQTKGFEIAFSCTSSDLSCGEGNIVDAVANPATRMIPFNSCNNPKYLLARHTSNNTTYAGILVCENKLTYVVIAVVESRTMDTNKLKFIDSPGMKKSLLQSGHVNIYSITFDTDQDTIRPDSKPTLDEIGKLLKDNPGLHLQVVGHTDATGSDAHNIDLSSRRAGAVIRALVQSGIEATRLSSRGAGASQPVAANDSADGRAKNRRVELVGM